MNRKLIHSMRALAISMSFLAIGLIAASFTAPTSQTPFPTGHQAATGTVANGDEPAAIVKHGKRQSRARNSGLTLPFFSFAQGLRRGNRS